MLTRAWWSFTELGFYDHLRFSHWVFALFPLSVIGVALLGRPIRSAVRRFAFRREVCLSACIVATLFVMLIGATTLFGDKYDYVGLHRYYLPVKPLYFVLFAAPVLLVPSRAVRVLACVGLLLACSWLLQQEWPRPYQRWLASNREQTHYGQWARSFAPNAAGLYDWLKGQAGSDVIVASNFHEYISLETGIPTLPIPPDRATFDEWIERIRASRGITEPRVLFVLDPDNRWRDYWIADPDDIVRELDLTPVQPPPAGVTARVLEYRGRSPSSRR
jgi:hypothetical protein